MCRRARRDSGVPAELEERLCAAGGPEAHWVAVCTEVLPTRKLSALTAICDSISSLAAGRNGHEVSAEELLPLVSISLAHALARPRDPRRDVARSLLAHLRLAEGLVPSSGARFKLGYCLTTVEVAVRYVASQAPTT